MLHDSLHAYYLHEIRWLPASRRMGCPQATRSGSSLLRPSCRGHDHTARGSTLTLPQSLSRTISHYCPVPMWRAHVNISGFQYPHLHAECEDSFKYLPESSSDDQAAFADTCWLRGRGSRVVLCACALSTTIALGPEAMIKKTSATHGSIMHRGRCLSQFVCYL